VQVLVTVKTSLWYWWCTEIYSVFELAVGQQIAVIVSWGVHRYLTVGDKRLLLDLRKYRKRTTYCVNAVNTASYGNVFIALIMLGLLSQTSLRFVTRHYLQLNVLTLTVNHYISVTSKPFQSALNNPCNYLEQPFMYPAQCTSTVCQKLLILTATSSIFAFDCDCLRDFTPGCVSCLNVSLPIVNAANYCHTSMKIAVSEISLDRHTEVMCSVCMWVKTRIIRTFMCTVYCVMCSMSTGKSCFSGLAVTFE